MEEKRLKRKKEKVIQERNFEQIYKCCNDLGDEYLRQEKYELALMEFQTSEEAAKQLKNKIYIAIANRMIGETYCAMGDYEKAIQHQEIHLRFSREEKNFVEEQRALATLGRTYFCQADSIAEMSDPERRNGLKLSRKYNLKSLDVCDKLSSDVSQKGLAEMRLRLFKNLGLASDSEGDIIAGIDYVSEAIAICRHWDFAEELAKCYSIQSTMYHKLGDTAKAITLCDTALKLAERLERKVQLSCELLSLKADVLISLSDFNGAKITLAKAYKLKTGDVNEENAEIENKLKTVVKICKTQNELLKISETDLNAKRKLNETLGDCCVDLKLFEKANSYYFLSLECAEALGLDGKDLIPIYYSIWQTYKDNGQYELAMEYAQKEFELSSNNPKEACQTLLNIIVLLEERKESFNNIMEHYEKALLLAKKAGSLKLEATVLENMKSSQLEYRRDDLADDTQKELDLVKCCISNEELEQESQPEENIPPAEDVNLAELSDLCSDDDESNNVREKHPRRKILKSNLTKRNEKGETPLHVAAAKGNVQLLRSLLQQGHPVNIQDAAGWTPLHEASNYGQVQAAKILIESGAHIDDRGGPKCDGITPLLDAACNGHLELISLLLDKGASPFARSNKGETALDCLLAWKERAVAEGDVFLEGSQCEFDEVVQRLQDCLNKVGQTYKSAPSTKSGEGIARPRSTYEEKPKSSQYTKVLDRSRKRLESDSSDDDLSTNAAREYQDVMDAVRYRKKNNEPSSSEPIQKTKKPALLSDDDVGDDWLFDDVGEQLRRPAKRRCEQFIGQQLRNVDQRPCTSRTEETASIPTCTWENFLDDLDSADENMRSLSPPVGSRPTARLPIDSLDDDVNIEENIPFAEIRDQDERPKFKYQKSLFSVGFQRFQSTSHSTQEPDAGSRANMANRFQKILSPRKSSQSKPTKSIKLRIEDKLFLIPVPSDEDDLTIGWLVCEASRRYQNLEGVSAVLNVTTADGAFLDENDPLSIVMDESEVKASVVRCNLTLLTDRYKEACKSTKTDVDSYLTHQLEICEANACLQISDCNVSLTSLLPALKAISHQQNLQKICLSGLYLQDRGFKLLIDSIQKLLHLHSLDVSVNDITNDGLTHFWQTLSSSSFQMLEELDFSYNPLGEECVFNLTNISNYFTCLRVLNLKCVGLSGQSLYSAPNFTLDSLESLDVSYNNLEREGIAKFLSALNSSKVKSLNVSRTGSTEVVRECLLFIDRGSLFSLEALFLSGLDVDDADIQQLVPPLSAAAELTKLDLSNNPKITGNVHQHLSQLKNLKELDLSGCKLLIEQHELSIPFCRLNLSHKECDENFRRAPYNFVTSTDEIVF